MKTTFAGRLAAAALIVAAAVSSGYAADEDVAKAAPVAKAKPAKVSSSVRPLSVAVDLLSRTRIEGTLTDATMLDMRTSFGNAQIPLSEVAGIKFAGADDATTTVVMLNGDNITGATDVKLLTVDTEWGTAKINGQNVTSLTFVPGVQWNPDTGLNGKRWNLVNAKKAEPKPVAQTQPQPQNTRPVSTQAPVQSGYYNGRPVYRGR